MTWLDMKISVLKIDVWKKKINNNNNKPILKILYKLAMWNFQCYLACISFTVTEQ